MRRFWLACIFLCVTFLIKAQSADSLFLQANYQEAVLAYEFEYFQTGQDSSLLKKSWAYKAMGNYDNAILNLKRINDFDTSYELALLYYLNDQLALSNANLLRMSMAGTDTTFNAVLLKTMVQVDQLQLEEARNYLTNNAKLLGINESNIDSIFPKRIKIRNPDRAYNISLIAPGFGQVYAGYPGRGFVSGAMQLGTVGFTYWSLINHYYFSGVLTGAALFYTFYLGGARYAGILANERNDKLTEEIKNQISGQIKKPE